MNKYEKLEKIKDLLDKGVLSEQEYQSEKAKIMAETTETPPPPLPPQNNNNNLPLGLQLNVVCLLMHVSVLLGGVGAIFAIVVWAVYREQFSQINEHGKAVLNWLISLVIYVMGGVIVAVMLALIHPSLGVLGWLLVMGISIGGTVFTVIATIQANEGKLYKYPLSLQFIK
jgi:uncharacterized Tic20 family protein